MIGHVKTFVTPRPNIDTTDRSKNNQFELVLEYTPEEFWGIEKIIIEDWLNCRCQCGWKGKLSKNIEDRTSYTTWTYYICPQCFSDLWRTSPGNIATGGHPRWEKQNQLEKAP